MHIPGNCRQACQCGVCRRGLSRVVFYTQLPCLALAKDTKPSKTRHAPVDLVWVCVVADDALNVQVPYLAITRGTKPYKTWYIAVEVVRVGVAECIPTQLPCLAITRGTKRYNT